jgi:DNA repair protein RadC
MEKSEDYFNNSLFTQVINSKSIYDLSKIVNLHKQSEEVLACFALNMQHEVIGYFEVARGTLNASLVSPRELFKRLFVANAAKFILLHNHPSGDVTPSPADEDVTKRLYQLSKSFDIEMLDHVIVSDKSYTSLRELNIL